MDASLFPFPIAPKCKVANNKELAALLGITTAKLTYYAYHLADDEKYKEFTIRNAMEAIG